MVIRFNDNYFNDIRVLNDNYFKFFNFNDNHWVMARNKDINFFEIIM